jgi:hypothetical protein
MEAVTVLPINVEQNRALKAFLKALNIPFMPAPKADLATLEARLLPKQKAIWLGLKTALIEVENDTAEGMSWEDFKKELANDNSTSQTI